MVFGNSTSGHGLEPTAITHPLDASGSGMQVEPSSPHTPPSQDSCCPAAVFSFTDNDGDSVPAQLCPDAEEQPECFARIITMKDLGQEPWLSLHHNHRSSKHRKHRHERAASSAGFSSGDSTAETVRSRSYSFSSGLDSSGGSSSTAISSSGAPSTCRPSRPNSFTAAQLQPHRHRLSACTAARSSSPAGSSQEANCGMKRCNHCHTGSWGGSGSAAARNSSRGSHKQRAAGGVAGAVLKQGSNCQHRPVMTSSCSGAGYCAMDMRVAGSSIGSLPQRGLLLAESVNVQDIGKGFQSHWYSNRVLPVYDGSHRPANPTLLLKQVPQQPGLHLWLVKPPNSRQWVPVRLAASDNLQQGLAECLHADGSCGPLGFKQRVLLDLQCRGFALQIRYRPMKSSHSNVHQDLLDKLQRFDFALNDADNNGCRPIELPDGRPVHSYPWVAGAMMKLYEQLFVQGRFL